MTEVHLKNCDGKCHGCWMANSKPKEGEWFENLAKKTGAKIMEKKEAEEFISNFAKPKKEWHSWTYKKVGDCKHGFGEICDECNIPVAKPKECICPKYQLKHLVNCPLYVVESQESLAKPKEIEETAWRLTDKGKGYLEGLAKGREEVIEAVEKFGKYSISPYAPITQKAKEWRKGYNTIIKELLEFLQSLKKK